MYKVPIHLFFYNINLYVSHRFEMNDYKTKTFINMNEVYKNLLGTLNVLHKTKLL